MEKCNCFYDNIKVYGMLRLKYMFVSFQPEEGTVDRTGKCQLNLPELQKVCNLIIFIYIVCTFQCHVCTNEMSCINHLHMPYQFLPLEEFAKIVDYTSQICW